MCKSAARRQCSSHHGVDMHCTARIPAGDDGVNDCQAILIRHDCATQEGVVVCLGTGHAATAATTAATCRPTEHVLLRGELAHGVHFSKHDQDAFPVDKA